MTKASNILLCEGTSRDLSWIETLRRAAEKLDRSLIIVSFGKIFQILARNDIALIIFEDEITTDLPGKIKQIRSRYANTRIVVFSSAPGWKEATAVMRAGAIDYERKTMAVDEIYKVLKENLSRPPPNMSVSSQK